MAAPVRFALQPVPPFRLDLTVWTLRRRPHNTIDDWDGETYRRTLTTNEAVDEVEVRQTGPPEAAQLVVSVATNRSASRARIEVTEVLQQMLGLNVDLSDFYRLAEGDLHLRPLARRFRGAKPPRFGSVFECLVNAIACQQLTLTVGIGLLNRLTECYGRTVDGSRAHHAFPVAPDLAKVDPGELRRLGFSNAKARAVVELAQRASAGGLDLAQTDAIDAEALSAAFQRLRGIGRWSAEYALLRGLGRLDVFPGDDVSARNNLQRFLALDPGMDYDAVRRAVSDWSPYAGLVYFHLLLDYVERAGWLTDETDPPRGDPRR
jgi:DNA-3-methyladenine glycosylase II